MFLRPRHAVLLARAVVLVAGFTAVLAFHAPVRVLAASGPGTQASDGTWIHFPAVVTPDHEESGTFFYDAVRSRLLVFGGRNFSGPLNRVWSLSLTGPAEWTQITPLGGPPSPRYAHSMVYDSARDRLLVFGGTPDGVATDSDLWELTLSGTPTWNQLVIAGPPPGRLAHVATYDPVGDRMIVFGGYNAGVLINDTWQLSLSGTPAWTQL